MILIYKPWGSDVKENPRGFPPDYPRDSTRIEDGAKIPDGWISISELEYKALLESGYAQVSEINAQNEASEKSSNATKLDALKRLFDDCEAIDDAWATATNAQKFDLARNTFKILRRIRVFILDQYRPD